MTYEHEKQALDEVRETQVDIAQKNKSAKKTLLMSIIMGIIGPTTVGLGLLVGQSSTQFADFVRRSIEFLAIVISYVVYSITTKENNTDEIKKQKYEKATDIFVSIAMILSGIIMTVLALYSGNEENGNIIPGLVVAFLGLLINCTFWMKYRKLGKESNNKILIVQRNLYRAKTFVDCSIVLVLVVVLLSDNSTISYYFDLIGTACVSAYLIFTGSKSIINEINNTKEKLK